MKAVILALLLAPLAAGCTETVYVSNFCLHAPAPQYTADDIDRASGGLIDFLDDYTTTGEALGCAWAS